MAVHTECDQGIIRADGGFLLRIEAVYAVSGIVCDPRGKHLRDHGEGRQILRGYGRCHDHRI